MSVLRSRRGATVTLTLDNPSKGNALSPEMMREATSLVAAAAEEDGVRCLVLRGAGDRVFCSGYDLSSLGDVQREGAAAAGRGQPMAAIPELMELIVALQRFPWPTIALVNGHCIGGGMLLACCCDLRYGAGGARCSIPASRIGILYPLVGMRRLVALVGLARATQILMFGDPFSTDEALIWGFFTEVQPSAQLEARVAHLADELSSRAPLSLQALVATLRKLPAEEGSTELVHLHEQWMRRCVRSRDLGEGIAAVLQRRPARFEGR